MHEPVRYFNNGRHQTSSKMGPDIGPKKTMIVAVIVVGCFAVLWPKVFQPMFFGTNEEYLKPSAIDKTSGCCDVYSETDINTLKIMSELCTNVIQKEGDKPLNAKQLVTQCKTEILKTCGIDISAVLQEKIRLGASVKQIITEVRSLNGSLCLKYNYGVAPWRLGVPHKVITSFKPISVRQERPPHLRPEMMHPAFRERGSAIPHTPGSQIKVPPRIVEGRPGPIPGMRPPMGGAGHVVQPSQKGSSMGIIMPIYTIGIVIFFTYTLMKLLFKKQPDGVGGIIYPPVEPDRNFRKEVFESDRSQLGPRVARDNSKIVVNAMSALLDEVDEELEARRRASELARQVDSTSVERNGGLSNGHLKSREQPSVKILGMETTASAESGEKWNAKPIIPATPPPAQIEIKDPPKEIYLEGSLPAQSQLLVSDAKVETKTSQESNDAVVLAGKMTLSVISLDSKVDNEDKKEALEAHLNNNQEDEDVEEEEIEVEEEEEVEEIIEEIIEVNGDDELVTESKYTTASGTTAAEREVSDEEGEENTDDEDDGVLEDEVGVNHTKHLPEVE